MSSALHSFVSDKISIPKVEFDVQFSRSSGAGGQNVNKVNSKATIRWNVADSAFLPAGVKSRFLAKYQAKLTKNGEIIISSESHRDQYKNLLDCYAKLDEMLEAVFYPPKKRIPTKPTAGSRAASAQFKRKHADKKQNRQKIRKADYD